MWIHRNRYQWYSVLVINAQHILCQRRWRCFFLHSLTQVYFFFFFFSSFFFFHWTVSHTHNIFYNKFTRNTINDHVHCQSKFMIKLLGLWILTRKIKHFKAYWKFRSVSTNGVRCTQTYNFFFRSLLLIWEGTKIHCKDSLDDNTM